MAEASDFKFGAHLGFAKTHQKPHQRKSRRSLGLGELPNISHLRADCLYTGIGSGPNARYGVWDNFTFTFLFPGTHFLLVYIVSFVGKSLRNASRQYTFSSHCFNSLLPPKKSVNYILWYSDLSYKLPQCNYTIHKESFVNYCLLNT